MNGGPPVLRQKFRPTKPRRGPISHETLYSAVDRLEPELRDSVHLHYYQELTLQETADAMEVAASTVKYRLRQAMAELQKNISTERTGPTLKPNLKSV